jgi:protein SCO1
VSNWRAIVAVAAGLSGSVTLLALATDGFRAWTTDAARVRAVAAQPVLLPNITLLDRHRRTQTIADSARSTIVDFVYTRCPSLCGTLGATYQRLQTELQQRRLGDRVRLLTISFDPAWDTPDRLRYYAIAMRPDDTLWTIATLPDSNGLSSMLRSFGVRVIPDGVGGFAHNAALHVVDPQGRLVGIVPVTATADAIDLALQHTERATAAAAPLSSRAPVPAGASMQAIAR